MLTQIQKKVKNLPSRPGIYLFQDKTGTVLYVGKAKNLKKRVNSYFAKGKQIAPDKLIMLSKISNLDYIITDTEAEALLLEANLIKKHQPKYNIILRDDKNYLYIKLNLEAEWPRVELVRRPAHRSPTGRGEGGPNAKIPHTHIPIYRNVGVKDKFFGPYPSSDSAKQTVKLLSRIFKFCTCKQFHKKPCLKFHLGWCLCPAETKISNKKYRKIFTRIEKFLRGQTSEILQELQTEMKTASNKKNYEKAAGLRDQIQAIKRVTEKQKVISLKNENYDVISLARTPPALGGAHGGVTPALGGDEGEVACINLFTIRSGKLLTKLNFILFHTQNSSDSKIIESFISQYYPTAPDIPKEIILPMNIPVRRSLGEGGPMNIPVNIPKSSPTRGKKRQLIGLGTQNAQNHLFAYSRNLHQNSQHSYDILTDLKRIFRLPKTPHRIEAYDVSNISGQNPTGSMVVFTNGQPDKSEYRKFKIKGTSPSCSRRGKQGGGNDPAMLAEVISRRLKNKDWPLPDLILLDGGKPQLNAALRQIPKSKSQIQIIALAKREEEIYIPERKQPVILPRNSEILKLLQRLRDESHRFAKSYFSLRHQKQATHSALDNIPGLGPKTKKKLLQKFGSVEEIKKTALVELTKAVGERLSKVIKENLKLNH